MSGYKHNMSTVFKRLGVTQLEVAKRVHAFSSNERKLKMERLRTEIAAEQSKERKRRLQEKLHKMEQAEGKPVKNGFLGHSYLSRINRGVRGLCVPQAKKIGAVLHIDYRLLFDPPDYATDQLKNMQLLEAELNQDDDLHLASKQGTATVRKKHLECRCGSTDPEDFYTYKDRNGKLRRMKKCKYCRNLVIKRSHYHASQKQGA